MATRKLTLLATCKAFLKKENGEQFSVRILIDQGSELTFISESLVQHAHLKRTSASLPLLGIGGKFSGFTKGIVTINLCSIHDGNSTCQILAYVLPRLTTKLPPYDANIQKWPHIQDLQLADPDFACSSSIQIIIGSDNYGLIIKPGLISGERLSPVAQQTIFGWVLSGTISSGNETPLIQSYHCTLDIELKDLIAKFWLQEEIIQSKNAKLSIDEEACEQHYAKTVTRDRNGRYIVRLPFKQNPNKLGESRTKAVSCLNGTSKKFSSDTRYFKLYSDFFQEYLNMRHMSPVNSFNNQEIKAYLPHHGVLREQSTTTKLRVVFNASSRTRSGLSLNDILYQGPKLQANIVDVLLWIRMFKFLFSTDVVKMYRQIAVHNEDQDLQRVVWYDTEDQISDFKLSTVTYGLNCAPFLALRTMQQLTKDEGHHYPKAIAPLTRGRYMDDFFGGADTIFEAKDVVFQTIKLCEAGGFPLQKWNSNAPEILPKDEKGSSDSVEIEASHCKILGLEWKPNSDSFHFSSTFLPDESTVTKRIIASNIAKLYDPLGLVAPVLIKAKILLQELWLTKKDWDESLPSELQQRWLIFKQQLEQLKQISIPRWFGTVSDSSIAIHGFSDASRMAMAAVVYTVVSSEEGRIVTNIVCLKTKVAPIKKVSIPRLELSAALILARLIKHIKDSLNLLDSNITCWTDSSVTLTWINAHPARWKDFVQNRVSVIQEILPEAKWRFISGKENPADCATRGMTPDQLSHHKLWWFGPSWLSASPSEWPKPKFELSTRTMLEERPGIVLTTLEERHSYWDLLERYSSLTKLLRITAICFRFISRLRKEIQTTQNDTSISPMELHRSRNFWVRIVQQKWFREETRQLIHGVHLAKSNSLVRLTPFIDKDGLLRVGGRLQNAQIENEMKHQLILPRKSPLTTLIIGDAHLRALHGGTQITTNLIRETFWIIGGRASVRSYILKCGRCARYRGKCAQQLMGQLPVARVTQTRPFTNTGLDYAGPVMLKTWKGRAARNYKGYLSIFICLVTSAVHIEIVTDYSKDAFLAAFKRFTGRRGIPAKLFSDCGTNFIGADAELKRLFSQTSKDLGDLISLLANDGTEWRFNPPAAPHFGGKWEATVKSVKFHMKRVIGEIIMTFEELSTIIIQIEGVLNSRPLCPLSDDVTDISALTPGHFLIGAAPTTIPEPDLTIVPMTRRTRWQMLSQKVQEFWKRWSMECLQRYQAISKWHHPTNEIKQGSLVLITDERYPPGKWPLARVTELHPGKDGLTRVVTLKTQTTTIKRPIAKLCVMPTDTDD